MTLDAPVEPNKRFLRTPIQQRQLLDVGGRDARDLRDSVQRILRQLFRDQTIPSDRVAAQERFIVQAAVDDDLHHPERQRCVRPGPWLQVPVGESGSASHPRIDGYDGRTVGTCLVDERHSMHASADEIRAPEEHDVHVRNVFDVGLAHTAEGIGQRCCTGCGANRPLQARRAHLVEEALAHAREAEDAERAGIGKGLDGFGSELGDDAIQAAGDFRQCFVPGDALELGVAALRPDAATRIEHAVRVVHVLQVVVDLVAQIPLGDRMRRIALHFDSAAGGLVHGDAHRAGVGAVVRAGDVHESELALAIECRGVEFSGIAHRVCSGQAMKNAIILPRAGTSVDLRDKMHLQQQILRALALAAALCAASSADARLTRLEVTQREVVAGGEAFGTAGAYERLAGTAYFEVDPEDRRNAVVFDLNKAPRNTRGQVEFSADMVILKPVDLAKAGTTLFFEVNNRGRKISFGRMQDTGSDADMNAPRSLRDFGNGFLMKRGYVLAWVGWGADIAPGDNRLTVNFPDRHGERAAHRGTHPDRVRRPQLQRWHPYYPAAERRDGLQELPFGIHGQGNSSGRALDRSQRFAPAQRARHPSRLTRRGRSMGVRLVPGRLARNAQHERHLRQRRLSEQPQLPSHLSGHELAGDGAWIRHVARLRLVSAQRSQGRFRQS